MKLALVFIFSIVSIIASAEEVKKWVDDKGKVHYGNVPSETEGMPAKKLQIQDTFDQKEYENAKERHVETEQFGKELEKERKVEEESKAKEEAERKAQHQATASLCRSTYQFASPVLRGSSCAGQALDRYSHTTAAFTVTISRIALTCFAWLFKQTLAVAMMNLCE